MKYMGSKRFMLRNGLGYRIRELGSRASCTRFVDLFTGSGAVAHFAAQSLTCPVLAVDLQAYATALAAAVVSRNQPIDIQHLEQQWLEPAEQKLRAHRLYRQACEASVVHPGDQLPAQVTKAQRLCEIPLRVGPVWAAYGGHYYSPKQALALDYLRKYLPPEEPLRAVALAALLMAASRCAAAPGHTAQPFKPTASGGRFLVEAWNRDVLTSVRQNLGELAPRHAAVAGHVVTGDALSVAATLQAGDLVFVDPPYSGVHYSRFYHVLETIAQGSCGPVSGVGRYPSPALRPKSKFSLVSDSEAELENLVRTLASAGVTVLMTFPEGLCSNGLSGTSVETIARRWFDVEVTQTIHGSFSTMGGKKKGEGNRTARQKSVELLFVMSPKTLENTLIQGYTAAEPLFTRREETTAHA